MAWFEFHQSLTTHRKLYAMASKLRSRRSATAGYLAFLWSWALDNAPDGDLTDIDDEAIKLAADWPRGAGEFISALRESGFLDTGERRMLHDWDDYAGRLMYQRERNRKNAQAHRNRVRDGDVSGTSPSTVQYPTEQYSTQPSAPVMEPDLATYREAFEAYEQATGFTLDASRMNSIKAVVDKHPVSWVVKAIGKAQAKGIASKRLWSYAASIIESWEESGTDPDTAQVPGPHPGPGSMDDAKYEAHMAEVREMQRRAEAMS